MPTRESETIRTTPCPFVSPRGIPCGAAAGEGCRFGGEAIDRTVRYVHAVRVKAYTAAHPRGGSRIEGPAKSKPVSFRLEAGIYAALEAQRTPAESIHDAGRRVLTGALSDGELK